MKCPICSFRESKVVDSRTSDDGEKIKRRRECLKCQQRFTTYEILETLPLMVVKKDNTSERFNKKKLLDGILKACEKRSIPISTLENIINTIERNLRSMGEKEIKTSLIGEYVMDSLRALDKVAYIRFASVYRQFGDVENFILELNTLKELNNVWVWLYSGSAKNG